MDVSAIKIRYDELAGQDCCLSCGGAADKSQAQPGEVCIDLGSGRGTDVLRLAEEVGPTGFSYGVDVTTEMIRKAEKTATKMGIDNAKFIHADLEKIPLEDDLADLIISNCTLNHVNQKDQVWSEIYRLIKPGGRFVISDIYSTTPVPDEYRNDPEAVAECWAGAVTREQYMQNIEQAGFKSVEILEESTPYDKGKVQVCSFTIRGTKKKNSCCCGNA